MDQGYRSDRDCERGRESGFSGASRRRKSSHAPPFRLAINFPLRRRNKREMLENILNWLPIYPNVWIRGHCSGSPNINSVISVTVARWPDGQVARWPGGQMARWPELPILSVLAIWPELIG